MAPSHRRSAPLAGSRPLPVDLATDIERAGYFPALVTDVVATAVGQDDIVAHLVHQETTFDADAVRRHLTVLALTEQRLVIAHADDHDAAPDTPQPMATASSETVPLRAMRGVMLTHVVPDPDAFDGSLDNRAVTVTLGWGTVSRVDLFPGACQDPDCQGDHGYEGTIAGDDISLRVSAEIDGTEAIARALHFAQQLSARIGR